MADLNKAVTVDATVSSGKITENGEISNEEVNVSSSFEAAYAMTVPSIKGHDGEVLGVENERLTWMDMSAVHQQMQNDINNLKAEASNHFDALEVDEEGLVYGLNSGVRIAGPYGPFAGGGGGSGGSGGNGANLSVKNTTGWLSKTIAHGNDCVVSINWSSIEDGIPTGNGTVKVTVNGSTRASLDVSQGDVTVNVTKYLASGSNTVRVQVSDAYGNSRTINFSITDLELSISSTFDPKVIQTGEIQFSYTPVGAVTKTVYFILDDETIGTAKISSSGRQSTYIIPAQKHGGHKLKCYFEATINDELIRSNELYYEFISTEEGKTDPIIISSFNKDTVTQYTSIPFSYTVYTPNDLTSHITLYINNTAVSKLTVDRTEHTYAYKATEVGTLAFKIGIDNTSVSRTFNVNVTELKVDVEAVKEDLVLYLTASGRSNNEDEKTRDEWTSGSVASKLTNFNFTSDGWHIDNDNSVALRVLGDARVDIPYKPFEKDFRSTGKTIELEFATSSVMNYDSTIISCMSDGRGFAVTPQSVSFKSEQSAISTQFKEDEHVRISFVVEKRAEHRLIYCYINGIISGVVQYPTNDDFSQSTPVDITIGSNDCTTDIYCIRIYDNDLTREQVLSNWIADTQNVDVMLDRYNRNNVYDEYGNIVISKLPSDLPYMIITAPELPQYKGDKKTCEIAYTDPVTPSKSFTATNVELNVQGTSSQYYARKNYKAKFKSGLTLANGDEIKKYQLRDNAIAEKTFCFKADVASSEGANNVELVRLYNDACPYKTPPQASNPAVRQGIDGFPMVIFWNDGTTTSFLGKYNFNNDKSDEDTFGFVDGDESWEILNNTSDRVLWKSADFESTTTDSEGNTKLSWLNDFEARYPDLDDPYQDSTELKAFAEFVSSTDTTVAGLSDEQKQERLTKFKDHIGEYTEIEDAIYYYLFTELFLMVDSRAKNAFPSFMGSNYTGS